jgi:hypothetical protein
MQSLLVLLRGLELHFIVCTGILLQILPGPTTPMEMEEGSKEGPAGDVPSVLQCFTLKDNVPGSLQELLTWSSSSFN